MTTSLYHTRSEFIGISCSIVSSSDDDEDEDDDNSSSSWLFVLFLTESFKVDDLLVLSLLTLMHELIKLKIRNYSLWHVQFPKLYDCSPHERLKYVVDRSYEELCHACSVFHLKSNDHYLIWLNSRTNTWIHQLLRKKIMLNHQVQRLRTILSFTWQVMVM